MHNSSEEFSQRLHAPVLLLLDGATGTELERRRIPTELPLWSTIALLTGEGRSTLRNIHEEYIQAGAEIITANTFRTNPHTLKKANRSESPEILTRVAVDIARSAIDGTRASHRVFLAGSVGPVEDCYHPERVPPDGVLWDDHRRHIDHLFAADTDVYLVETMNTVREAALATGYAVQTGKPVLVSLILKNGNELLSGEPMSMALSALNPLEPAVIMLNCVGLDLLDEALVELRSAVNGPIGCYANAVHDDAGAELFADRMHAMATKHRLKIIGGCCGTTPDHIRALKSRI